VPIVTIKTLSESVACSGAALPHVGAPWANLPGAGVYAALPQNARLVLAGTPKVFVTPRRNAVMAQPVGVKAAGLPINIRKQYVHKTRVNVGGDGAAGSHPEREPA
jgi:hypothetical protein